jgi:hypothetical protein
MFWRVSRDRPKRSFTTQGYRQPRPSASPPSCPDMRAGRAHAAMLNSDSDLKYGGQFEVCHMCPPLSLPSGYLNSNAKSLCHVHVVGFVQLTDNEKKKIGERVKYYDTLTPLAMSVDDCWNQYTLLPSVANYRDSKTGKTRYKRFSCAGFVLQVYKEAGINLLTSKDAEIPAQTKDRLMAAYHEFLPKYLEQLPTWGMNGEGPWRIHLPGYVIHSLAREDAVVRTQPYAPKSAQEARYPADPEPKSQ